MSPVVRGLIAAVVCLATLSLVYYFVGVRYLTSDDAQTTKNEQVADTTVEPTAENAVENPQQ